MADIQVKTDAFEGPMELLCRLIDKNEINIEDIPIAAIAEQYIEAISAIEYRDMDDMSEFSLMAATLLEIKSAMLLPKKESEDGEPVEDPREQLARRIAEYKKFKEIAELFKEQENTARKVFYKTQDSSVPTEIRSERKPEPEELLGGLSLETLYTAFVETLNRKELKIDKIRSGFNSVKRDLYTIEDKQELILNLLVIHKKIKFQNIFDEDSVKLEMIVTFLALLELIKLKKISVSQKDLFNDIIIQSKDIADRSV